MLTPKKRLLRRFERALSAYDQAAVVQEEMATRLVEALRPILKEQPRRVLEIGAGTGFLTRRVLEALSPKFYLTSDLVPACGRHLKGLPVHFVAADGEDPSWVRGKFDLILANATFQWFRNLQGAFEEYYRLLHPQGILAFTTFGPDTMKEVLWAAGGRRSHLRPFREILSLREGLFAPLCEERWFRILYFEEPLAVLRHIRATGAMGFLPAEWSLRRLKTWQERYSALKKAEGFPLTYEALLFIWEKP